MLRSVSLPPISQFSALKHHIRSFTFGHDVRSHISQLPNVFNGFASAKFHLVFCLWFNRTCFGYLWINISSSCYLKVCYNQLLNQLYAIPFQRCMARIWIYSQPFGHCNSFFYILLFKLSFFLNSAPNSLFENIISLHELETELKTLHFLRLDRVFFFPVKHMIYKIDFLM